jgi:FkbM family methyltransferase
MLNLRLNNIKNVFIVNKAAWDKREKVLIYIPKGFYGYASACYRRSSPQIIRITTEGFPLDDIFRDLSCSIKLIKIDAEGAEYRILKGMEKALSNTKYVVISPHFKEDSLNYRKIILFLTKKGFLIEHRQGYIVCQHRTSQ